MCIFWKCCGVNGRGLIFYQVRIKASGRTKDGELPDSLQGMVAEQTTWQQWKRGRHFVLALFNVVMVQNSTCALKFWYSVQFPSVLSAFQSTLSMDVEDFQSQLRNIFNLTLFWRQLSHYPGRCKTASNWKKTTVRFKNFSFHLQPWKPMEKFL